MDLFASPIELGTALQAAGIDPVVGNTDELNPYAALQAVQRATSDIQSVAGWHILQETVVGRRVDDWACSRFSLPTLRLTALSVSFNGVPMGSDTFAWSEDGEVELQRSLYPWTVWPWSSLLVTYTHGWPIVEDDPDTGPPGLRSLCLDLAVAYYDNPTQLQASSNTGAYDQYRARVDLSTDPRLDPYRLYVIA